MAAPFKKVKGKLESELCPRRWEVGVSDSHEQGCVFARRAQTRPMQRTIFWEVVSQSPVLPFSLVVVTCTG